ncbi:MAG: DUF2934 domain-containing protein [Candidatus Omnitrophica bacterium]|nr:DUF2934 domain-containing protein [Candidatus Omnitrophota bacterium]
MVMRRNNTNKKNGKKLKTFTTTQTMTNANDLTSKIQQKAYCLFEKRGYSHGNDWSDWLKAECQVKKELGVK